MKVGGLFSGGKDSMYAAWLAKKEGYSLGCLITMISENKESFMFHTPSIEKTKVQARVMNIPQIIEKTKGTKEGELDDLKKTIEKAIKKYAIKGIVTGAVNSVYQSSRIQKICNTLGIECFNPLWQKRQQEILENLLMNKFDVV